MYSQDSGFSRILEQRGSLEKLKKRNSKKSSSLEPENKMKHAENLTTKRINNGTLYENKTRMNDKTWKTEGSMKPV